MPRKKQGKDARNKYRNDYEREFGEDLEKRRVKFTYEKEKLTYTKTYLVDFKITTKSGKEIYVETKGVFRALDTAKYRAVKKDNPNIDLRFVFFTDKYGRSSLDRKIPHSKSTHKQWCEKNNFKYAVGTIPNEWLKE